MQTTGFSCSAQIKYWAGLEFGGGKQCRVEMHCRDVSGAPTTIKVKGSEVI